MSTFFRQEEIYVTEEELEKTYNYIKNIMDSKISQIQKTLGEMQQKLQQKDQAIQPDIKQQIEIKQQILEINSMLTLTEQEVAKLNKKIESIEKQLQDIPNNQPTNELDITMYLEQMSEQTGKLQEQIDIQIKKIEADIKERVEEKLFEQNVEVQKVEQLLTLKMNKNSEETRNTREEIEKTKLKIEEIQLEWKDDENNRVTRYEIEQLNQKLLQIENELKNSQTKQEIEDILERKIKTNKENIEQQIEEARQKLKQELEQQYEEEKQQYKQELEKQTEEKIRKIVEEMLEKSTKEVEQQKEENTQVSQILAIIK